MKPLAADEKTAMVMLYTRDMLVRGEIVVKENARVSIWPRMQGTSNYVHVLGPNVILLAGSPPKSISYPEMFIPMADLTAFHLAPPIEDPIDYDTSELNRMMLAVEGLLGSFVLKGKLRISTQTDAATFLEISHSSWVSVYDAEILNPSLPQFNMRLPMLLVNPRHVSFGIS